MSAALDTYGSARPIDLREPPHNFEAEIALLGALLSRNDVYAGISDFLIADHFYVPVHQRIYAAIVKEIEAGNRVSPITLRGFFDADEGLKEQGGAAYLGQLLRSTVTYMNVPDYGREIQQAFIRRQLIELGDDIKADAYEFDQENPPAAIVEAAEQRLTELSKLRQSRTPVVSYQEAAASTVVKIEEAYKRKGPVGLRTGFSALDGRVGGLRAGNLYVLGARPSIGKAQPLDANVLRRDGTWSRMGDLKFGDELASVDGQPSRVAGIFPQGLRRSMRLTLSDGRSVEACEDHLWRVHCRHWSEPRILSTAEISKKLGSVRYQGRLWIDLVDGDFGAGENLPLDPYVLGCLLGDGNISRTTPIITSVDQELLDLIEEKLCGTAEIRRVANTISHRIITTVKRPGSRGRLRHDRRIPDALISLGLMGCRSQEKFVPGVYLRASREARLQILRGLMDTDGWALKHASVGFSSCSRQLALDVQYLVRSLGGLCRISEKRTAYDYLGEKREGMTAYICKIRHTSADDFFLLQRKIERATRKKVASTVRLTIESVEQIGAKEMQCISVTHPSKLYVTDDFIVTHNTTLAWTIAANLANSSERRVTGFFSQEMEAEQLVAKELAYRTGISVTRQSNGEFGHDDMQRLIDAGKEQSDMSIYIDGNSMQSVAAIRQTARRIKRKHGLDLIIIDHLQLMRQGGKVEARRLEIGEITGGLKALGKELGVPVILLSQLSRSCEARDDKRPMLSDLRESGDIEQDADVVMFLYRHEYYLQRQEPQKKQGQKDSEHSQALIAWETEMHAAKGAAELIVAKSREGQVGTVHLRFDGMRQRFHGFDAVHGAE